jgi:hypothetical protein
VGLSGVTISDRVGEPEAAQDDGVPLDVRRRLSSALNAAKQQLAGLGSPPSDAKLPALEETLRLAASIAAQVPAYLARIDAARRSVHALTHPRADHLGMTGSVKGAIDSILENLIPEDDLDSGADWKRRRVLADTIAQANAGTSSQSDSSRFGHISRSSTS